MRRGKAWLRYGEPDSVLEARGRERERERFRGDIRWLVPGGCVCFWDLDWTGVSPSAAHSLI